jgi:hypothetical protein
LIMLEAYARQRGPDCIHMGSGHGYRPESMRSMSSLFPEELVAGHRFQGVVYGRYYCVSNSKTGQ